MTDQLTEKTPYDAIIRNAVRSSFGPVDKPTTYINGQIYEDKKGRFLDGAYIHTSAIIEEHGITTTKLPGISMVRTKNSVYKIEWAIRHEER